jgi:glycosyltransferase involved in cell wall biosynthesis
VSRVRQYRNLDKMPQYLRYYLSRYTFSSAREVLRLSPAPLRAEVPALRGRSSGSITLRLAASEGETNALPATRTPVSVVIPCYNEELILPYLANTLTSVREQLSQYDLTFIFVDDKSTDGTWAALNRIFGGEPHYRLVRHADNRGVAAGILSGIQNATTEIVCSMDCDCTYDPHELAKMIPLLTDGVDMVTASPYHPQGAVRNVPEWRLALSKTLSRCYRVVLHQRLATYTSCFRVYRRSAMTGLSLRHEGFLGVAEMLGRLDLRGSKIAEYPATLEVRMLGRSKMKIVRTIAGHIGLLMRFVVVRLRTKALPKAPPKTPSAPTPTKAPVTT